MPSYLTATYRSSARAVLSLIEHQLSPTLGTWSAVTPDFTESHSPDPITGAPPANSRCDDAHQTVRSTGTPRRGRRGRNPRGRGRYPRHLTRRSNGIVPAQDDSREGVFLTPSHSTTSTPRMVRQWLGKVQMKG